MAQAEQQRFVTELPITERSNNKTRNIDTAAPLEIIDLLHACEKEIFTGWEKYQKMLDQEVLRCVSEVSIHAAKILKEPSGGVIIMSGCGTSGRLAFFVAAKMNDLLSSMGLPLCFDYIIAGGFNALTHSVEAYEDSPEAGKKDLIEAAEGKKRVLFIGITCGLSAPFVAGQLHHCMANLDVFTPVLLGFNPSHQARNQPIEGWDQTFLSVTRQLEELQSKGQGYLLNPVLGPEPITGSSRLKGGGATKLLLETCFLTAISSTCPSPDSTTAASHHQVSTSNNTTITTHPTPPCRPDAGRTDARDAARFQAKLIKLLLESHHRVWEDCYQANRSQLAKMTEYAGRSLNSEGHVYYVGWDTWGTLSLIDASECPPTFGSDFDDVRGFLKGGLTPIASFQTEGDEDFQAREDDTSVEFFMEAILPFVCPQDTVFLLLPPGSQRSKTEAMSIMHQLSPQTQQLGIISTHEGVQLPGSPSHVSVRIGRPQPDLVSGLLEAGMAESIQGAVANCITEFAVKSALNAISTGAHIMRGKVFQNYMVDLRLSNSKLFQRGTGIVEKFANCTQDAARDVVMRSIFRTDDIAFLHDLPVSSIIQTAANVEKVVPIAIILAIKKCTVRQAQDLLIRFPVIRTSLRNLMQQQ